MFFLVRIEDTDQERSKDEFTNALLEDLHWLGLDWQEGPEVGGPAAPYFQSQRQPIYDQYYHALEASGRAYPCFCSEAELTLMRKVQVASGTAPRYSGTCRSLSADEIAAKLAAGLKPTLRFRIPEHETISFKDLVHGEQNFKSNDIGDFIIRRGDGTSPFMFCNAIDDALMGVTHVIRGQDHLTNTPRQIMILEALGLPIPEYGHISLITGDDGSPLSKRNGSRSVHELREQGYLPLAINNYLARLGHYYENPEFMSFDVLAQRFDCTNLSKSPARYDAEQLLHWQKEAIAHMSDEALLGWLKSSLENVAINDRLLLIQTIRANIIFPVDAQKWVIQLLGTPERSPELLAELAKIPQDFLITAKQAVSVHGTNYPAVCDVLKAAGFKGKALFHPLRLILTGADQGPELAGIFRLLGRERLLKRLEHRI